MVMAGLTISEIRKSNTCFTDPELVHIGIQHKGTRSAFGLYLSMIKAIQML